MAGELRYVVKVSDANTGVCLREEPFSVKAKAIAAADEAAVVKDRNVMVLDLLADRGESAAAKCIHSRWNT